jgi:hypothetical protein
MARVIVPKARSLSSGVGGQQFDYLRRIAQIKIAKALMGTATRIPSQSQSKP